MTISSAPGKIILFGEHAVVYGHPALAIPVTEVSATATVEFTSKPSIWLEASGIGLSAEISTLDPNHPLVKTIELTLGELGVAPPFSLMINIDSTIPVASGLGSGAAVTVALIRAMSSHFEMTLPDEKVSSLAFQIEKLHHGTPSGIDNSVITYAKPIFFVTGNKPERLEIGKPFTFLIGDTGISASTKDTVHDVRILHEKEKKRIENIFDMIGDISISGKKAVNSGNTKKLGELMNINHSLLQQLSVSSKELDQLVDAARQAGAFGAKLSGGGRGGNMIALVGKENAPRISEALKAAGATRTIVTSIN